MDQFQSSGGSSSHDLVKTRLQRIRRVLGVAGQRVRAVRRDHEAFWLLGPGEGPALDDAHAQRVEAFKRKAEHALRLLEAGEKLVAEVEALPPAAAVVASGRFDPEQLAVAVRELDALIMGVQGAARAFQARALDRPPPRPAAPAPARPPQPAPPQKGSGPLSRWLTKLVESPAVRPVPPPPPRPDPVRAYMEQLEASSRLVRELMEEVASELGILRAALEATRLPTPRRPWPEVPDALDDAARHHALDPVQSSWLMPVAKRIYGDADAMRKAHMAVAQWLDLQAHLDTAARHAGILKSSAPARQADLMAAFHPGKLRAAALPLSRLHLSFAGVPVLSRLFPDPAAG